jgi:hypothetical protein
MQSSLLKLAKNAKEAEQALLANMSPRQRELDTLERYAEGKQYEGLPDWFTDQPIPLWQRAPCIIYTMTKSAIQSNVDLVLGEGRFPNITSNPGEDDGDEEQGLDETDSENVDRALVSIFDRVRFRVVSRQALHHAQQAKSVAGIAGTRNGKPFIELVRSKWCEPTFDETGERRVIKLTIRYAYVEWLKEPDGTWKLKPLLYRRVIDDKSDTTYKPVECRPDGREPSDTAWVEDPARTVKHDLGFCPVHWYAFMRECTTVADYDGVAIHQDHLQEIRGLDFCISQKHRAALFCGDPQIVETGVEKGFNPSGDVGTTSTPASIMGGPGQAQTGAYQSTGGKAARIKSPGAVWQYEDPNAKVDYLVLPPGALEALDTHAADLRNKLAEALFVVVLDPQNLKLAAAISGKAIEQLRARQFDRCDQIRDDVAQGWLLPMTKLLLRVALATDIKLKSFIAYDGAEPMLFIKWPAGYVKPDAVDEQATVTMTAAAKEGGFCTQRQAVEKVASIFGTSSVDQILDALSEEKKAAQQEAMANLHAATAAAGADDTDRSLEGEDASGSNAGGTPSDGSPVGIGGDAANDTAGGVDAKDPAAAKSVGATQPKSVAAPIKSTKQVKPKAPAPGMPADVANISQAASPTAGITESVYEQLAEDFPAEAIQWVRAAHWEGPVEVPIDQIDFSNVDKWKASKEPEQVQVFVEKIQSGDRKPIILVNEPNNERLIITDGHHRALAYKQLGLPAVAYVAKVGSVNGAWDEMHDDQFASKHKKSAA